MKAPRRIRGAPGIKGRTEPISPMIIRLVSIRKPLFLGERMFDRTTIRSKKIYGAVNNSEISTQEFNPNAKA
jgi:hypothetical protein